MNSTSTLVHGTLTKDLSRRLNGYQPLDRYDSMHSNDHQEMGYRSERAKQRQVFLKSYRLESRAKLRRRSGSLKLKKNEAVRVVAYSDSTLCSGKLPAFHQPGVNTTLIQVVLTGKSEFGSGLQEALMDNRETGKIPLLVMVSAPISVVLKSFPLREVVVNVNCSLVVDNLAPNKKVRILSSEYAYAFNGMKLQM
uniref:Late embryogenesis abundant protein LEA-2 subgroup domain-containing protein n=1 Tax=Salix viminalis TaxID=40686 RepID=A0A6N2M2E7_SALVM